MNDAHENIANDGSELLPLELYTAADVRELDRLAIASGITGISLMKRAGHAAFNVLINEWPECEGLTVFVGGGNNGGDGYVIAALAAQRLLSVEVVTIAAPTELNGDAQTAYQYALQEGVQCISLDQWEPKGGRVIVDALLGTGFSGVLREPFVEAITTINDSGLAVLAVDVPSGMCADTGSVAGGSVAVAAQVTVAFVGVKRGLLTGRGPELAGEVYFNDLHVTREIYTQVPVATECIDLPEMLANLPVRAADTHKGELGHVMIIGGDYGFGGAVILAAEAAARAGAGLISVATRPEHVSALLARCPEVMAIGVTSGQELAPWLARPSVLVVGPGLGQSPWSEQMLQQADAANLPMVVDADALNILSANRVITIESRENWLLTPHPGEAARLLNLSTAEVQADRFTAVRELQGRFGGVALLKGAGSLIADGSDIVSLLTEGNSGMASGGMGDVLSGLLGSLIAQGIPLARAAKLGSALHAAAADAAVTNIGVRSLLASDLLPYVCDLLAQADA